MTTPRPLRFVDAFWGTDFTSTAGFDTLHQRMKDAKMFTDDVATFMRQRALIEETYAKSLMKLAKNAGGAMEIGSLRATWDVIRQETMQLGDDHMTLAARLNTEIERPVKELRDTQKDMRKKVEDKLKRTQKTKALKYKDNDKARKTYESKFRESERADEEASKGNLLPQKEQEKLRAKARKAKGAADAADSAYQDAVRQLDEARLLWEKEMESCCKLFQSLEEDRIDMLRRRLWLYTNVSSNSLVLDDQRYENMRLTLEKCSPDEDIQLFLHEKQTGRDRPAAIEYREFYATTATTTPSSGAAPSSAVPAKSAVVPPGHVVALHEYKAQGDLELSLRPGDIIEIVNKEDDVWWCGRLNGAKGMFPANFVQGPK